MNLTQAQWFKATASTSGNGGCVEVAVLATATAIRDSQNPGAGAHIVPRGLMRVFLDDCKAGRYDR